MFLGRVHAAASGLRTAEHGESNVGDTTEKIRKIYFIGRLSRLSGQPKGTQAAEHAAAPNKNVPRPEQHRARTSRNKNSPQPERHRAGTSRNRNSPRPEQHRAGTSRNRNGPRPERHRAGTGRTETVRAPQRAADRRSAGMRRGFTAPQPAAAGCCRAPRANRPPALRAACP